MYITGIAHTPSRLHERTNLPSGELIYLAKRALKVYRAKHLITSLAPGWEQALVKAAVELNLPFTVAVPYPGRDTEWEEKVRVQYLTLLARADEVFRISECYTDTALLESHLWRVQRADVVLALWDYEFAGETYEVMDYGLENRKTVVNLWQDWVHLYSMRRQEANVHQQSQRRGAQVYEK